MSEIYINITNIQEQIQSLNLLAQEAADTIEPPPEVSGAGAVTMDAIQAGDVLKDIGLSIQELLLRMAIFLTNAGNSFRNTDSEISQGYDGG